MSVNNTQCSPSGTCNILDGTTTNGTMYVHTYNPDAPIYDAWRPKMELATIIIVNFLTFAVIVARLGYRWKKFRRFRGDDRWMIFAGIILIGYTVSQVGTNRNGSGLHFVNVPEPWRRLHWFYMTGWCGYWIVTSCIKLSACCCFLQILPTFLKGLRIGTYVLCALIASLGITMTFSWLFMCEPIASNFVWTIQSTSCINYDIFRWLWIAVSLPIDMVIMFIPLQILKKANLRTHERRILKMVFSATLLGTITCTLGIYAVYVIRTAEANDMFYQETAWIMMNDIEIFMYTLGASFPVLSNYIVQRTDPGPDSLHSNFSSWARYIPNFFSTNNPPTVLSSMHPSAHPETSIKSLHTIPSETSGPSEHKSRSTRSGSMGEEDLEKGEGAHVKVQTQVVVDNNGNEAEDGIKKYKTITTTEVIGPGWHNDERG